VLNHSSFCGEEQSNVREHLHKPGFVKITFLKIRRLNRVKAVRREAEMCEK